MRATTVAVLLACTGAAFARDPDGPLRTLLTPNEGRPAVVTPGESFTVDAEQECALSLRDGDRIVPLAPQWRRIPGGIVRSECVTPRDCAPGIYALAAGEGDETDVNVQSVFVFDSLLDAYDVAHIASPRFGPQDTGTSARMAAAINAGAPAVIVVSGPITANGSPLDYLVVLGFIRSLRSPVLVAPATADGVETFRRFFGPPVYALQFGRDAYLSVGVDAIAHESDFGPAYRVRRSVRSARWSVGVASLPAEAWPMRAQIALLVDDPLDFLLLPGGDKGEQGIVPWNTAVYITTPPAANGQWRVLHVEAIEPSAGEVLGE